MTKKAGKIRGTNIYSGTIDGELAAALTNPTELARRKGKLGTAFPVEFRDRVWPDAEAAYLTLARFCPDEVERDNLMIDIIYAKFVQHPKLLTQVYLAGGEAFLSCCRHFTGHTNEWTGVGQASRFIRNLVAAYKKAAPNDQ